MLTTSRRGVLALPVIGVGVLAGCTTPNPNPSPLAIDPSGRADPEQRTVLEALARLNPRPIETLTPAEARRQPTYADAVRTVAQQRIAAQPLPGTGATNIPIRGANGIINARLYGPELGVMPSSGPITVYFHGGGFVIADLDVYEGSARGLARATGARVLAVRYRQGPEDRFPAAHDDAVAAWRWALNNARALNVDPSQMAVAGESAGGSLAMHVAMATRDAGIATPRAIALIYPVAGTSETPSYATFANAKPLNRAMLPWFLGHYTRGPADLQDPRLAIYERANLSGLPPVVIVNAEIDPLLDDGARLESRLSAAGVRVTRRVFPGVTHEFFGGDVVLTRAREAQDFVGAEMRNAFASPALVPARGRRRGPGA